jgi:hypothetical protein
VVPSDKTMRSTQPLKMSTRDFSWGKGGRCVWLTTYHPCSVESRDDLGALTYPESLGPPRPVAGYPYFTLLAYGMWRSVAWYRSVTAWEGATLSSTLIVETTRSSKVTVKSFQTTHCLISEHRWKNPVRVLAIFRAWKRKKTDYYCLLILCK